MSSKVKVNILIVAFLINAVILAYGFTQNHVRSLELKKAVEKAQRFDLFCSATRSGVFQDMTDFRSNDPVRIKEAADRFYSSQTIHHGILSLQLCLEDKVPPLACSDLDDMKCRGDVAEAIFNELANKYR